MQLILQTTNSGSSLRRGLVTGVLCLFSQLLQLVHHLLLQAFEPLGNGIGAVVTGQLGLPLYSSKPLLNLLPECFEALLKIRTVIFHQLAHQLRMLCSTVITTFLELIYTSMNRIHLDGKRGIQRLHLLLQLRNSLAGGLLGILQEGPQTGNIFIQLSANQIQGIL